MSTFLVVNNSSMLCSSTANLPYVQVENEYLPLTTQTDRGRIDVHITDEYTTYNVINLTTTTSEMTVEETVETTGYSGTYEDVAGEGTVISDWRYTQRYALSTYRGVRYSENSYGLHAQDISCSNQSITYTITFADIHNENILSISRSMPYVNYIVITGSERVKQPDTLAFIARPNITAHGNGFVVHYSTTSYVSSTTSKLNSFETSNRTYYSYSTYQGNGTVYNSMTTYTITSSASNESASDYTTNLTVSTTLTQTSRQTTEVTSSSFTTSTYTETQTRETTEWSGATTSSSSSSGIFVSNQYRVTDCATLYSNSVANTGNIAQEINVSFYPPFNVTQTLGVNIAGYQEITQFYLTFYDRTTTQITSYPPQQETWFITSYPQCITNESGDPERTSVTVCSVTQFASMVSDKTISTSSYSDGRTRTISSATTISYLNGNSTATMLGLTSTTSSESNASCSESYVTTITDTFTHTMTITGEVH